MPKRKLMPMLENEKWLFSKYRVEGLTLSEIGESLGRSESVVRSRLKEHGIPLRDSGPRSGEEHPNWGSNSSKRGGAWERKRKEALERDGWECQGCGMSEEKHQEKYEQGLNVHHKVPYRSFDDPSEANELENLITYCWWCHRKAERS